MKWTDKSDFHDVDLYHAETSPLICCTNQWTGSYIIGTNVVKELKVKS